MYYFSDWWLRAGDGTKLHTFIIDNNPKLPVKSALEHPSFLIKNQRIDKTNDNLVPNLNFETLKFSVRLGAGDEKENLEILTAEEINGPIKVKATADGKEINHFEGEATKDDKDSAIKTKQKQDIEDKKPKQNNISNSQK